MLAPFAVYVDGLMLPAACRARLASLRYQPSTPTRSLPPNSTLYTNFEAQSSSSYALYSIPVIQSRLIRSSEFCPLTSSKLDMTPMSVLQNSRLKKNISDFTLPLLP